MRLGSFPFVWVILGCGALCLLFIIGNLVTWGLHRHPAETRFHVKGGVAEQGLKKVQTYGCIGCHAIPGVQNAVGRVGPKLEDLSHQTFIAGRLQNSPENLVTWIQDPQHVSPGNAMPDLGVTEQDAKDIAAYLYQASQ